MMLLMTVLSDNSCLSRFQLDDAARLLVEKLKGRSVRELKERYSRLFVYPPEQTDAFLDSYIFEPRGDDLWTTNVMGHLVLADPDGVDLGTFEVGSRFDTTIGGQLHPEQPFLVHMLRRTLEGTGHLAEWSMADLG